MKKQLAVCMAALTLFCAGCKQTVIEAPEPAAQASIEAAPAAALLQWQMREELTYFPEGSSADTAVYVFQCAYPYFSGPCEVEANRAIDRALEEYRATIQTERLPLADAAEQTALPYTHVASQITQQGVYTNVCFEDASGYGEEEPERASYAVVLDENGEETNLPAILGMYMPRALIAQQIYNQIDAADPRRERYHGDLTLEDIDLALDLYNGFTVSPEGFVLMLPCGTVEDESYGVSRFTVTEASLYPDFVGELIAAADYEALLPGLHTLARACGAETHSFEGTPDALIATLFMGLTFADRPAENGVISVPQAEYEAEAKRYFSALPDDLTGGDGTVLSEGTYRIPVVAVAEYRLRVDDCVQSGSELRLRCMLYYGMPGSVDWGELSPVTVKLQKTGNGYIFTGFLFS
ncbi:MAG: hypothetical protein PHC80_01340 [Eubacteriales bacterium]|nr:hypothetical protein [Eubacteriales bacterium]